MKLVSFIRSYRRLWFGSSNSVKRYTLYMVMALAVMMMSWEASAADVAIAGQAIPEQSIRLRILANSDSPADQLLKRKVRDAVVDQMNAWVAAPDQIEQARTVIEDNIPKIERLVEETMRSYGYDYEYAVELGQVDFPTKIYGNQVYPAGQYEALRISIGKAEGQNWWCVLFPPLCFVDMASGGSEAVAYAAAEEDTDVNRDADVSVASSASSTSDTPVEQPLSEQEKEARFFLWDMLQGLMRWIGSLF